MSGFANPAAAKISTTPSGVTAREMICRTAWSSANALQEALLGCDAAGRWTEGDARAWWQSASQL